jgi:hypothetical protein
VRFGGFDASTSRAAKLTVSGLLSTLTAFRRFTTGAGFRDVRRVLGFFVGIALRAEAGHSVFSHRDDLTEDFCAANGKSM